MTGISRREFLSGAAAAIGSCAIGRAGEGGVSEEVQEKQAQIAITLDLEMSRNFPTWETTHWDYEKGNLNPETKRYAVEACRRVKRRGGVVHCFAVGRTLEQENVDWLKQIAAAGHPIGNHTYDHVNVLATKREDIQYRFRRSPWLLGERPPAEVIRENIRLTTVALKQRADIEAFGFRTPGGFRNGLNHREDVQQMLLDLGFTWVSSKYPRHEIGSPGEEPPHSVIDSITKAQADAQPFAYPSGLVEIPMSPISDIGAFRSGRWKLEYFLRAVRAAVEWSIEQGAVFDFLGHPSCLYVTDPEFKTIEMICDLVERAGQRAAIVDLKQVADTVKEQMK